MSVDQFGNLVDDQQAEPAKKKSEFKNLIYIAASMLFMLALCVAVLELVLLGCTHDLWHGYGLSLAWIVTVVTGVVSGLMEPE